MNNMKKFISKREGVLKKDIFTLAESKSLALRKLKLTVPDIKNARWVKFLEEDKSYKKT